MKKVNKARIIFSAISVVIVSVIVSFMAFTKPTHAIANVNPTARKWVTAMYYNCLRNGHYAETISKNSTNPIADMKQESKSPLSQPLPSLEYFKDSNPSMTCGQVLTGDGIKSDDVSGVTQMLGIESAPSLLTWTDISTSPVPDLIEILGYSPEQNNRELTFAYKSKIEGRDEVSRHYTSAIKVNNGKYEVSRDDISELDLSIRNNKLTINFSKKSSPGNICQQTGGLKDVEIDLTGDVNQTFNRIREAFNLGSIITETCRNKSGSVEAGTPVYYYITTEDSVTDYTLGSNKTQTAKESIKKMGYPEVGNLSLEDPDDSELYNLYAYYLQNANKNFNANLSCEPKEGYGEIRLKSGGQWYKYYLNTSTMNKDTKRFVTLNVSGDNVSFDNISMDDIINWLNAHGSGATDTSASNCPVPDAIGQIDASVNTDGEQSCFDNAESLGWVVCPIIKGVAAAVDGLYSKIVEPLLEINVSAFNQNNDAYKAWQYFQSIANIVFVILFLVVIISQITGVGIDNLGIKRILPKLIVAAILVNLSYIICMALVDVSNIVGHGLKTVFDGFVSNGGNGAYTGQNAVNGLLSLLGLGGGVAVAVVTAPLWSAAMIPALLLGLISILIGIITMFVLLGVYQAGVIAAVVVSPIAFVLYMLPNTKSIFDRWRKLFQGLLLLYPLCGLVIGLGGFIGKIIQNVSDSFFMSLLGALLSVIPFFFIPKLLKASMNAMGNIGAKISGIGKGLSGKTTGAIQNTEAYKDMMARRKAGLNRNGEVTARGKLMRRMAKGRIGPDGKEKKGILARAATRQLARGQVAYRKREDEITKGATMLDPNNMAAQEIAQQKAVEKEALMAEMAVVNNSTQNGEEEGKMYQMYDEAVAGGNVRRARAIAEIAGRRKDTASRFLEKLKEDSTNGMYNSDEGKEILKGVSKQIATGEGSKNYRAGNATGFEFASQTNSGKNSEYNYGNWSSEAENISDAIDHHITKPEELVGQTKGALRELVNVAANEKTKKVLSELAKDAEAQKNVSGGAYDISKKDELKAIRNLSSTGATSSNSGFAQENQNFNIQQGKRSQSSPIATPGSDKYNQLNDDFKNGKLK